MIQASFERLNRGYRSMKVVDHGKTEVCNAVSAIAWALMGTVLDMEDPKPNIEYMHQDDGIIEITVSLFIDEQEQKILDHVFHMAFIGFKQIEQKYPQDIAVIVEKNTQ